MSGLEGPAIVAGGGRLLGGLVAPAGRALARRASFRWMVCLRVRKKVDFACRWRTYRRWLKTITAEELARPVEEIHGPLAKRLDEAMSAASKDWVSSDDHLSRALRLVEMTYPAIAASLGDGDRSEVSERWAQQRSASVRDLLLQIVGPGAAFSANDLGIVLQRRSEARRAVRLQVFEVDEPTLTPLFGQIPVLDVPRDGVVALLGDFGSGKSEIAETWHRATIRNLIEGHKPPFPVWLSARDLLSHTLEGVVERQLGPAWREGRGASIVVDGLDEVDPATAQTALEAGRTLTKSYANVRILLTARPGILSPTATEEVKADLLTEEGALELVELAGGKSWDTWRWTGDMRATVTRPFFALAAGAMLGRDKAPRGEAELIRELVENALAKGTERSAVTSLESRGVLANLAVSLTREGADGLSFSDRQVARSSRLIADGPDGSVLFSLPIFQHWFAAQSILDGDIPPEEVVADSISFNRWRWAAAVAVLSAQGAELLDDLVATWVAHNPGAASWILKEAFSGHRDWRTAADKGLDSKTSGARLLRSLRSWTNALGPMGDGVLPLPMSLGPVGLGVTVSGHRIDVAFSTSSTETDHVTEVPPGVHPFCPTAVPSWVPWFSGSAPEGDVWPWTMVQKSIAGATLKRLSNDPFLGAPDGVWSQERIYDLARNLLGLGSLFHGDLPADEVSAQAKVAFAAVGNDRDALVSFRGPTTYSGAELEYLVAWIDAAKPDKLGSHLPERDVPHPTDSGVWDMYSPKRLIEFELEVYGRACEAYDEAMASTFARIGWSMSSSALAPFGVILEILFDSGNRVGNIPRLTVMRVPMALMPQMAPSGNGVLWSASKRAVAIQAKRDRVDDWEHYSAAIEAVRAWLAAQNREPIGGLGWSVTGADDMSNVRPASSVAARWLWDDLKSIGLGEGTFPQLR